MSERSRAAPRWAPPGQSQQEAFDTYVRSAAGSTSAADELTKLADLQAKGVITAEELSAQKARLLA